MTERFNRSITRFGSHCPALLRAWFGLGSVISTLLILPSIYLLVSKACTSYIFRSPFLQSVFTFKPSNLMGFVPDSLGFVDSESVSEEDKKKKK
jgi:hypothetical protein